MIFYFSGCGNSRFVAENMAERLNETLLFIPEEAHKKTTYHLKQDESLGFVFPVYAWAPPNLVSEFILGLKIVGKPSYTYIVCTYGDECGKTREILTGTMKKIGLVMDAFFGVQMPETYINLPGFKLDTIENEKKKIKAAQQLLPSICSRIENREKDINEMTIGPLPILKSYILKPLFYATLISDKPFKVEENCTGCGTCAKSCSFDNIKLVNGRPQWQHSCVGCMSCYHHCPTNSIHFGNATIGKGQYYFGRNKKQY